MNYALVSEYRESLPIIVTASQELRQGKDVYELVKGFQSVKPQAEKVFDFRKMVEELCPFEHSNPEDFTLWKIVALTSVITKTVLRVATQPAFGKDSVITCLGYLLGDTANLNKPSVAKLEYELTNNLILMNEIGTLSGENRQKMEDFLLDIGDMKNNYTKKSRAGKGTKENYNIKTLSLILSFNTLECYPNKEKYFDYVFNRAVYDRFIPFRFEGKITEHIKTPLYAKELVKQYKPFYEDFIRSVMFYMDNFEKEAMKKNYTTLTANDCKEFPMRHKEVFNKIVIFIHLYAQTQEEANELIKTLIKRNHQYTQMVRNQEFDEEPLGLFANEVKM